MLSSVLRQQQLLLADTQAGIAARVRGPGPNPLYSYIHLGVDHESRRQMLSAIQEFKIQDGVDYVEARSRHLDLLQPYAPSEWFVDAQGNFCCPFFDMTQFTVVKSVRQLFDRAMFHFMNEEISISERLECITVCGFTVESNFINCRLSSTDENGVKNEMNTASFEGYVDADQSESNEPFAVLVRDNVDVDELYPYSPNERVRKDHMGAILLAPIRVKKNQEDNREEEIIVVMRRTGFVRIYRPTFPLPERTRQGLFKGLRRGVTSYSLLCEEYF